MEVTSEAPQVDTTSTQLGAVINDRSVNELPLNTRDTYQFLQLQPGVQAQLGSSGSLFFGSDDAGSVSVNGGRTRANNFSVNGGDANDQFVNTPTIQPIPDAVEEFRVITNTFDAEYGRNSGSVVNVITKSGANTFHGNVYEYFRNTILDARGYPAPPSHSSIKTSLAARSAARSGKTALSSFFLMKAAAYVMAVPGQLLNVPTPAEGGGDFSGAEGFANGGGIARPVCRQALDGRSGCDTALGWSNGRYMRAPATGHGSGPRSFRPE